MDNNNTDYIIDDDDGFENYVQTTVDPGASIFVFTSLFCTASFIALPFLVSLGNRRAAERKSRKESRELEREHGRKNTESKPGHHKEFNLKFSENEEVAADDHIRYSIDSGDELSNGDELSLFSILEKDMCDDNSTQGDGNDSYCFGVNPANYLLPDILQTPFCCVGPDMKAVELHPLPPIRDKKRKRDESNHISSCTIPNYPTSAAVKRSLADESAENSNNPSREVAPNRQSRR
jgi:hypothetical protein